MAIRRVKFPIGDLGATTEVTEYLRKDWNRLALLNTLIDKHQSGDWGAVSRDAAYSNLLSVKNNENITSVYMLDGLPIKVITSKDRKTTLITSKVS